jgi:hypothetical protein
MSFMLLKYKRPNDKFFKTLGLSKLPRFGLSSVSKANDIYVLYTEM